MRRIEKDNVPAFWSDFVTHHKRITYDELDKSDEGKQLRHDIREHMVTQQCFLCCYCCRSIDMNNSHNEHIKPRDSYPKLSMDYNNLLVSCKESYCCGMFKDRNYSDNFISPLHADCESHFSYSVDGRIKGLTEEGNYTVKLLNLNDKALVDSRAALIRECYRMNEIMGSDGKKYIYDEYIAIKDGRLPRFVDMVQYFYNSGYFDIIEQ